MSRFLTDFHVSQICDWDEDDIWQLTKTLVYQSDRFGILECPAGFMTDFASVPRVPIIYSFYGNRAHREAVLHDFFYRLDAKPQLAREEVDYLFLEAMEARHKPWYIRYPMYAAVRLASGLCYHRHSIYDDLRCCLSA